ncbi:RING/U-box superfamily protein [Abeliophyllum distichum]|uniref:E3 ubiquitin-protein ligase RMA n=1 Tax=Abeliophyllum distichum TaxID=126358 RepID=A0ABD1Q6H6_9LAMI
MSSRVGESTNRESPIPACSSSKNNNSDNGNFECNICSDLAQDPIVTLCGHLFCWPCLYKWLHIHSHSQECPRPETAPPLDPNANAFALQRFGVIGGFGPLGGFAPVATARSGNFTLSVVMSGLFPFFFNIQAHGFPEANMYGLGHGYPSGHFNMFHCGQ